MKRKLSIAAIALAITVFSSCANDDQNGKQDKQTETTMQTEQTVAITEQEVLEAQKVWGEGIVHIGKVYMEEGDYQAAAEKHIDDLYYYNIGKVLFKPTMAATKQFRTSKEGALSYFVGHNTNYPEDHGFAIKPWSNVRWGSIGVKIKGNMALAMGNYFFTDANSGEEVKVEYTMGYTKDESGKLRIIMHGSHFPYSPQVN